MNGRASYRNERWVYFQYHHTCVRVPECQVPPLAECQDRNSVVASTRYLTCASKSPRAPSACVCRCSSVPRCCTCRGCQDKHQFVSLVRNEGVEVRG